MTIPSPANSRDHAAPPSNALSRRPSASSIRHFFSRGRLSTSASQRPGTSYSRSRPTTRHNRSSSARSESPHLPRTGSKVDSYKPTTAAHGAHVERTRAKVRHERHESSVPADPPPLFQAYPQALRHATLDAPCLPVDVILRKASQPHSRNSSVSTLISPKGPGATPSSKQEYEKHTKRLYASINGGGWTTQLFVLLTSGFLLQYAGDGHHDRLPERMMPLGKDTVAFASDAIPGRHWVLQVSQAADDDRIVASEPPTGIRSRLGMQNPESRLMAWNFLLVFDSPEELDIWMTLIRREVEMLGGREYGPASAAPASSRGRDGSLEKRPPPLKEPSHPASRAQVDILPSIKSPTQVEFPKQAPDAPPNAFDFQFWDNNTTAPTPTDGSSAITSTDLDRIRDSQVSGGTADTGTTSSYHASSCDDSPVTETFTLAPSPPFETAEPARIGQTGPEEPVTENSFFLAPRSPSFLLHALDSNQPSDETAADWEPSPEYRAAVSAPNFSLPNWGRQAFATDEGQVDRPERRETNATGQPSAQQPIQPEGATAAQEPESKRPVSVVAPLPGPIAFAKPVGFRNRDSRRTASESAPATLPTLVLPKPGHERSGSADAPAVDDKPDAMPNRVPSREQSRSLQSTPTPAYDDRHLALPRSKSDQDMFSAPSSPLLSPSMFPAPPSTRSERPVSVLRIPGRPTTLSQSVPSTQRRLVKRETPPTSPRSSDSTGRASVSPTHANTFIHVTAPSPQPPIAPPSMSLPMGTQSPCDERAAPDPDRRTLPASNARLARIRDQRRVSKLGVCPRSPGPPPTCPLPDTPSPRRRKFMLGSRCSTAGLVTRSTESVQSRKELLGRKDE